MKTKINILIVIFSISLLPGCAKSVFDNQDVRCPFADRGGCQSMDAINKMVDENRYTPDGSYVQQYKSKRKVRAKGQQIKSHYRNKVSHMWVSPWKDEFGALHESSYIDFHAHTQIRTEKGSA